MAVNTAGQGVGPRAAYSNAQRPVESFRRGEPQAGGNKGGPARFPKALHLYGMTTARPSEVTSKAPGLPRHAAFSNAEKPRYVRTSGNSIGSADRLTNHATDAVAKAARTRITGQDRTAEGASRGDEYSGKVFRPERPAFGPIRPDRKTTGRDHTEHEAAPGKRIEGGSRPVARSTM